ncbi:MAG: sensor domain-containing diguanylate cyclase [Steroidobacteraceae bacterium]
MDAARLLNDVDPDDSRRHGVGWIAVVERMAESQFDDMAFIAARACAVPTMLVCFSHHGERWVRGSFGIAACDWDACSRLSDSGLRRSGELLIIPDLLLHDELRVSGIDCRSLGARFAMIAPLLSGVGDEIGAVLALDSKTRSDARNMVDVMQVVAGQIAAQLESFASMAEHEQHRKFLETYQKLLEDRQETLTVRNERFKTQSLTDELTGLANRRAFDMQFEQALAQASRYGQHLSLMLLDVDHFKSYNDEFGHPAGDLALVQVASLLRDSVRKSDTVARYGGEEFAIILPVTEKSGAMGLAERFRAAVANGSWEKRQVTISIGVATYSGGRASVEAILGDADAALYRAKSLGRNCVVGAGATPNTNQPPLP